MDKPRVPNPFVVAKRSSSVTVELSVEDVLNMRPCWSRARAEQLLSDHSRTIAASVLSAGLTTLLALIEAEEQCQGPIN